MTPAQIGTGNKRLGLKQHTGVPIEGLLAGRHSTSFTAESAKSMGQQAKTTGTRGGKNHPFLFLEGQQSISLCVDTDKVVC